MSSNKVLISGFFDLFHMGHLLSLQRAREQGDYLIVHVASDVEAKTVKGDLRPIIPGKERAEIIRNLRCVDAVIYKDKYLSFEEVLKLARPQVIIRNKGGNLEGDEEAICKKYGVRIVRLLRAIPESKLDTTKIVERILYHGSENRKLAGINYVLVRPDKKILLQKRDDKPGILSPGMFCFPGGALEEREDAFTAMLRESQEETGIELNPRDCRFLMDITYPWGDTNRVFVCKTGKSLVKSLEGKMYWKTLRQVKQTELAANQSEIINKLELIWK